MALELNGKVVALEVEERLKAEVEELKTKLDFTPILATIIVGDDMASVTYVNMKAKACERMGLKSNIVRLPKETTQATLFATA